MCYIIIKEDILNNRTDYFNLSWSCPYKNITQLSDEKK